ncbi:MAG: cation:dicarboxylase symporter family transporter [Sandaracinaceae bacterium]|nr:cation:dicarboxylase symporter family transporter [Sandaracinaceae bacterium]
MTSLLQTQGKGLYLSVLFGMASGITFGIFWPEAGSTVKWMSDLFLRSIRMLITPIVFVSVSTGIAKAESGKRAGRIGIKALIYFEIVSTLAMALGWAVAKWLQPGKGIHADINSLDPSLLSVKPDSRGLGEQFKGIVPESLLEPFVTGEILPVLLIAGLFGVALLQAGPQGASIVRAFELIGWLCFRVLALLLRAAPFAVFGAMAHTVGRFGLALLGKLMVLVLTFYLSSLAFIAIGLGGICQWVGVPLSAILRYIREELFIVFGTSSSEPVLPRLMDKLVALGCPQDVVRLVLPTGYSFNLDGTSIYMTLAALFVAQALDIKLSFSEEFWLFFAIMLTSKGAAAVTGGGLVALASALELTKLLPVGGLVLVLGVDRLMSEARALTNAIGNTVAVLAISRWEGGLDVKQVRQMLRVK